LLPTGSLPLEEFTSQLSKARAAAAAAGDAKTSAQKHRQQQKQKQQQQVSAATSSDMSEEPPRPTLRPLFPGLLPCCLPPVLMGFCFVETDLF
jgi:hypothetical protein